jgi:hypothetical protein
LTEFQRLCPFFGALPSFDARFPKPSAKSPAASTIPEFGPAIEATEMIPNLEYGDGRARRQWLSQLVRSGNVADEPG